MTKHNYFSSRVCVKVNMTNFKPTFTSQRVYKTSSLMTGVLSYYHISIKKNCQLILSCLLSIFLVSKSASKSLSFEGKKYNYGSHFSQDFPGSGNAILIFVYQVRSTMLAFSLDP